MVNNLVLGIDLTARWVLDKEIKNSDGSLNENYILIKEIDRSFNVKFFANKDIKLLPLPKPNSLTKSRVSLLKSNLQKAVRQGDTDIAVMSTLALIELDCLSLLRRLPIIIVEDKYGSYPQLHDHLATLLFMMATEKGIANYPQFLVNLVTTTISYKYLPVEHVKLTPSKSRAHLPHVKNLILRQAYGGMKGDMYMFNWMIEQESKNLYKVSPPLEKWDARSKRGLELRLLPHAVDFHNCPKMITELQLKFPTLTEAEIKSAIWLHSSSLRNDAPRSKELIEVWKTIQETVRQFQIRNISKMGYLVSST